MTQRGGEIQYKAASAACTAASTNHAAPNTFATHDFILQCNEKYGTLGLAQQSGGLSAATVAEKKRHTGYAGTR